VIGLRFPEAITTFCDRSWQGRNMQLSVDPEEIRSIIHDVVTQVLSLIDWPTGRVALDETEAAQACGVGRHVLRDLRLAGKIKGRKLGKKIVYTREDLLNALNAANENNGKIAPTVHRRRIQNA
jgi:hypothetical protein